uniref:Uncharacterized protein n=1 Tax=Panagrolaimus davidi TaxID=227884 RepID=A0A914QMS6_9BILA
MFFTDGRITKIFKNYSERVDRLTGLSTLDLLEKLKDMTTTLSSFGVPVSQAIGTLLDQGIAKIKPDLNEALILHHNKTMTRFNSIKTQISSMKNSFEGVISEIDYEHVTSDPFREGYILLPYFVFCSLEKKSLKTQNIHRGTNESCPIPSAKSFENYVTVSDHFEFFEQHKIEFWKLDYLQKRNFLEAKNHFYSSILNGAYEINDFEDRLTDFKLADTIQIKSVMDFFHDYSSGICYLSYAYIRSNHSREGLLIHGLELAQDIVKSRDLLLMCGNYSSFSDKMLQNSLLMINESITNMQNYTETTLRLSWPTIFKKYSMDILSTSLIPKEKFNETSKIILQKVHMLGPQKFNYVVFLSKFTDLDQTEFVYTSCTTESCLTFQHENLRCFIYRFMNDQKEALTDYHSAAWWRSGAGKVLQDVVDKNQKVDSLKDLYNMMTKAVGNIKYKNVAFFRDSALLESNVNVSIGFSSKAFDNDIPYRSLYSFYQPPWYKPTVNYEEFFLFFID